MKPIIARIGPAGFPPSSWRAAQLCRQGTPRCRGFLLRLLAQPQPRVFGERPGFGFVLDDAAAAVPRDSMRIPGGPIIVTRDELVEITVRNHLAWPLSVLWHGIELDSYFDGVAGWSGMRGSIAGPRRTGARSVARR